MRNTAEIDPSAGEPTTRHFDADDPSQCAEAARILRSGGLVAFATETVYGLGANAGDAEAVARLYAVKRRPRFNPLIVHLPSLEDAGRIGRIDGVAATLAKAFWPGPLTLVVALRKGAPVADLVTAGLDTVALRVPGHRQARDLLRACGAPVVAPSANVSGHVSATTADHVLADLEGRIDAVVDAGPTSLGVESTIVGVDDDGTVQLLRPGAISRSDIEAMLGKPLASADPGTISAPGQLASHYAPHARLRLDAESVAEGEILVAFGTPFVEADPDLALSLSGDLTEAAARLFMVLRRLDQRGIPRAAIMPVPDTGLGEAINDRLRRAAAPRNGDAEPIA